jgi:hypothetical protein
MGITRQGHHAHRHGKLSRSALLNASLLTGTSIVGGFRERQGVANGVPEKE